MMLTTCFLILVFLVFSFRGSFGMASQNLICSLAWGRRADTQSFTFFSNSDKFIHRRASSKYKSIFSSCVNIKQSWLFHVILHPQQRWSIISFSFLHICTAQLLRYVPSNVSNLEESITSNEWNKFTISLIYSQKINQSNELKTGQTGSASQTGSNWFGTKNRMLT